MAQTQKDYSGQMAGLVLGVMIGTLIVYKLLIQPIRVVRHSEVMIVERFGKFLSVLRPGLHWVWPIIDSTRKVHWRYLSADSSSSHVVSISTDRISLSEHLIQLTAQVISKDGINFELDGVIYFRIVDALRAVYSLQNLPDSLELLTQSTLRQVMASLTLDDAFSSRELINAELLSRVQQDSSRWGILVSRVEIMSISAPGDIQDAMVRQITAERERRSVVLRADGERESTIIQSRGKAAQLILQAEGNRTSTILRAKGGAEARKVLADAEAQCLADIRSSVSSYGMRGTDYLSAVEYLNTLSRLTSQGADKVVMVPVESMDILATVLKGAGVVTGSLRSR